MDMGNISRREALKISGMGILGVLGLQQTGLGAAADSDVPVITMNGNFSTGQWSFDPIGLYIQKGQKVRWTAKEWGCTVFAFHPSNYNHELRIPEGAKPFGSGDVPLMKTSYQGRNVFEWTFDVEGTYDCFSRDQEILGMVCRIVVGKPGGPAEKPPGYGGRDGRSVVFPRQVKMFEFCPATEIVAKKSIPYPKDFVINPHPYGIHG